MSGYGERDWNWRRARGHHLCLTDTIFQFGYLNQNRVLLTIELFPNISLVVGQASVNISIRFAFVIYSFHD